MDPGCGRNPVHEAAKVHRHPLTTHTMSSRWLPPPDGVSLAIPANRLIGGWVVVFVLGALGAMLGMLTSPSADMGLLHVGNLVVPCVINAWVTYQVMQHGVLHLTRFVWIRIVMLVAIHGFGAGFLALALAPPAAHKLAIGLMQSLWFITTVNQILLLGFSRGGQTVAGEGTETDD